MAILDEVQIKELIKLRPKKDKINEAIIQDSRLRFHTVPSVEKHSWTSRYTYGHGYTDFISWVTSFLKKEDKVDIFKNVMRPPHDSNELTKEIFKELKIGMYAQDKHIDLNYSDPKFEDQFIHYRKTVQNDLKFMEERVFWAAKSAISAFLIVDSTIQDGVVVPYSYLLTSEFIIDYQLKSNNFTDYLIFYTDATPTIAGDTPLAEGDRIIAVIDEENYWLFSENKGDLKVINVFPHEIGWAPAKPIWSDRIEDKNELLFEAPLSTLLGALDWYLFFSVSKRVIDTYGPWPIVSMFATKCSYKDTATNAQCDGGWLHSDTGNSKRCPVCSDASNLVGAGSIFRVPAPSEANNYTSYTENAVKFVTMKTDILQYITDQKDKLHDVIYRKSVGKDVEALREQAVNEKQVQSGYESRHAVLSNFARNMQIIHKFDLDTKNRIMFGDGYLGSNVSYGSKFFLRTLSQLNEKYDEAKKAGASSTELKTIRDFIRQHEYRDNPDILEKMQTLSEIEPFSDYSIAEVVEMQVKGNLFVSRLNFILKLNFNKFVQRFEREELPVNEFGKSAPRERKISRIEEILLSYAKEEEKLLEKDDERNARQQQVTAGNAGKEDPQ